MIAVSGIMLAVLIIGLPPSTFHIHTVKAGVITVPDDYPTIQEAIDHASVGDTIYVKAGTYYENVVVNKKISLIGQSRNYTIIDGGGIGNVVLVRANNVTIERFTLRNTGGGVDFAGIFLDHSNDTEVRENELSSNYAGVYSNACFRINIEKNIFRNNLWGLQLNLRKLPLTFSGNNNITDNYIIDNGGGGILVGEGAYGTTISNNTVVNSGAGIDLEGSPYYVWQTPNSVVENTVANCSDWGIYISYCWGKNILKNNTIYGCKHNFGVIWGYNHDIDDSNTVDGRPLYYLVNQNDVQIPKNAGYVAAINCERITAKNLTLSHNIQGVLFVATSDSVIEDTIIHDNKYGILFDSHSSSNIIFHNNFVDNTYQCIKLSIGNNVWDGGYPSGGNYWSDYSGTDSYSGSYQNETGSDGIGDAPYAIDEINIDNYPLMSPWTGYTSVQIPIKGGENATITSNVTITKALVTKNTLHFEASGPSGFTGWMNVTFPTINTTGIKVFINGTKLIPPPFPIITTNGTHYFIYFECTLSTDITAIQFWLLGDITGPDGEQDCKVDIIDLTSLASAYGSYSDHLNWNPMADLTGSMYLVPDGKIDVRDLALIGRNYGKTCP